MLALTLLAYIPAREAVYLVEEPENGIHPRNLEIVFQSLSSVLMGKSCLRPTHLWSLGWRTCAMSWCSLEFWMVLRRSLPVIDIHY